MATLRRGRRRERVDGFTVVEVVVAISCFSIILLGVVGMQASALKLVRISRNRTTATELANRYVEKMRSLPFDQVGSTPPQDIEYNHQVYRVATQVSWASGGSAPQNTDYKNIE